MINMSGAGYAPLRNNITQWCLAPGEYNANLFDNNVVSSANASMGWDGGTIFVTTADGCILLDSTVPATAAYSGSDIYEVDTPFVVPGEGAPCAATDLRGAFLDLARNDLGTCPYGADMIRACGLRSMVPTINEIIAGSNAQTAACDAVCATSACDDAGPYLDGPVPAGYGCCTQNMGLLSFAAPVWQFHPAGVDYHLIPSINNSLAPTARYPVNNNRLVAGLLLEQTRAAAAPCAEPRFGALEGDCLAGSSSAPYGVDPVFVASSDLYDGTLDPMTYYATSEFNARNVPYGFFPNDGGVFDVVFDTNIVQQRAHDMLTYLQEGFFIDGATTSLTATLVTYNGPLRMFSAASVDMRFLPAGGIAVTSTIDNVVAGAYSTRADFERAALEAVFVVIWALSVRQEVSLARRAHRKGVLRAYLLSPSTVVDVVNFALGGVEIFYWLVFQFGYVQRFSTPARFDVYADLKSPARFLALANGGAGLAQLRSTFSQVRYLSRLASYYIFLHGVNIVFMLFRIIKLCHFQPHLGILTRTLARASKDMAHYVMVLVILFLGCSSLACLVFGPVTSQFNTWGHSFQARACAPPLARQPHATHARPAPVLPRRADAVQHDGVPGQQLRRRLLLPAAAAQRARPHLLLQLRAHDDDHHAQLHARHHGGRLQPRQVRDRVRAERPRRAGRAVEVPRAGVAGGRRQPVPHRVRRRGQRAPHGAPRAPAGGQHAQQRADVVPAGRQRPRQGRRARHPQGRRCARAGLHFPGRHVQARRRLKRQQQCAPSCRLPAPSPPRAERVAARPPQTRGRSCGRGACCRSRATRRCA